MKRNDAVLVMIVSLILTGLLSHFLVMAQPPKENSNNGDSKVVLLWNIAAYDAMGEGYLHSLMASRINAMVHVAMHDAVNAAESKYETYLPVKKVKKANAAIAAAVAAHTVLIASFPGKRSMLDSVLAISISGLDDNEAKAAGMKLGINCGNAVLGRRAGDGSQLQPVVKLNASTTPGVYNIVPPFDFVFAPFWKNMKLFSLEKHDQFRSAPPPALTSKAYTDAFNEVKLAGNKISKVRTTDQTNYAKFWYEYSEIGWNRMARIIATDHQLDLHTSARLFALLNMAMADSYTAGWDSKFHYNFWRPYTAIRAAADDGNAATEPDFNWEPLEPTPPVPDYPSTHSVLGKAAATVLAAVVGDNTNFTMVSKTPGYTASDRTYKSFNEAAYENADSRLRAGIHFRFAFEAGLDMGKKIGDWTVQHYLKPVK